MKFLCQVASVLFFISSKLLADFKVILWKNNFSLCMEGCYASIILTEILITNFQCNVREQKPSRFALKVHKDLNPAITN